jgi:hypothetical protein
MAADTVKIVTSSEPSISLDARPAASGSTRRWVIALALWSLLVWGTRIDNILADVALTTAGQVSRVALALSFVVPALIVLLLWWRRPGARRASYLALVLAGWTAIVWIIRGFGIAIGDHEAAFIVVHLVLAVASIAIAAVVWRSVRPTLAFVDGRSGH